MRRFLTAAVVMLLGMTACTEGAGLGLETNLAGTYELEAIDGQRLPYTFYGQTEDVTFYAGQLRLERGGDFEETVRVRRESPGRDSESTERYTGRWEASRGEIVLDYDGVDGARLFGEYDSREVVLFTQDGSVTYRRY